MRKEEQHMRVMVKKRGIDQTRTRIELAKTLKEQTRTRAELAKTRREQAKTRTELAKTRAEQTKTRVELAKSRKKKAGIRAAQVAKTVQRVVHKEFDIQQRNSAQHPQEVSAHEFTNQKHSLERLTDRQRQILRLIAQSQNTKQIAGTLRISSKTVEYHRKKLMDALNVHDIPGLVRFALQAGLIAPER
jgi:DNA-binding NarL/FixJ family response regulator